MPLISYCTHLSIKGPWRVGPTRPGADMKMHAGRKQKVKQTSKKRERGRERRRTERKETNSHSITCS